MTGCPDLPHNEAGTRGKIKIQLDGGQGQGIQGSLSYFLYLKFPEEKHEKTEQNLKSLQVSSDFALLLNPHSGPWPSRSGPFLPPLL